MKFKSKKSQITLLMAIGLVLFIIVGLILYLSKSTVKKQSQQTIKRVQSTSIEIQPTKEFVAKCLDKLAKDAIISIGKQGGYLYRSQGGALLDHRETDQGKFFLKYDHLPVAYNILPPKFSVQSYSSKIPDYPWTIFPYKDAISNIKIFDGFFGINNMPPLNPSEGQNSIQTQIETFIDSNMADCADFEIFEKQGLAITMSPAKTSVVIGDNDISISSKIPIKITNPATKEFAELSDFSTNIDVRLKDIYFFVNGIIQNDIKYVNFNIRDPKNNKDSFSIQLIEDIFSNDDLIIVTDEKSLIYGRPFKYIFSRRNRAPALFYIKNNTLEFSHLHEITMEDLLKNSEFKAEDPDEDNYTFTVTPTLPKVLNVPQIKFKVEVSDGSLSDYQTITVNRI